MMSQTRIFGSPRPNLGHPPPRPLIRQQARGNERFFPLPTPTGASPYRIRLTDILGTSRTDAITPAGRLVFHVVGDTGGVRAPVPQTIVARKLEDQLATIRPGYRPAFFYHLGDVIYFNGETSQYFPQFYHPYEFYDA